MSETKWNKKIDFTSKPEDIVYSNPDMQEGFDEIAEMERKLDTIRNEKKGFTKLPFLESIYEMKDAIIEPLNVLSDLSNVAETTVGNASVQFKALQETAADQLEENQAQADAADGAKQAKQANETITKISKNFMYYVKDMSKLTDNVSNDLISAKFKMMAKSIAPKAVIDKDDQKRIAEMFDRVFTGLIAIFIAYNLYFIYSVPTPPSGPDSNSVFDMIDNLPTIAFPLQCALTPIKIFLLVMSYIHDGMSFVPYKSLLFILCMGMSYSFLRFGITRYFIDMFVSGVESMSSKKGWEKAIKQQNIKQDLGLILMILGCTITHITKLVMITPNVIDPRAIIGWIAVFGISLLLLPVVKVIMGVVVFYVCMLSMVKSKDNGINIFGTISDIDRELIGNLIIYDCDDDSSTIKQILSFLDKDVSRKLFKNLYLLVLGPVLMYNIKLSEKVKSTVMRGLSNVISFTMLIALASTNEFLREGLNSLLLMLKTKTSGLFENEQ